jgi:hypothetical protein
MCYNIFVRLNKTINYFEGDTKMAKFIYKNRQNQYETKGVFISKKDLANGEIEICYREKGEKENSYLIPTRTMIKF